MQHLENLLSYINGKIEQWDLYLIINFVMTMLALIFTTYVIFKETGWLIAGVWTFVYILTTVKLFMQEWEEGGFD